MRRGPDFQLTTARITNAPKAFLWHKWRGTKVIKSHHGFVGCTVPQAARVAMAKIGNGNITVLGPFSLNGKKLTPKGSGMTLIRAGDEFSFKHP